jgi:hypothetical protein
LIRLALAVAALASLVPLSPARSAAAVEPATCEFGAYLSDLYDTDATANTFTARIWTWTRCPNADIDPLPRVSFPNGVNPTTGEPNPEVKGGTHWNRMRLEGTFRYHWDVRNFPFDRQTLPVLITAPYDLSEFRFVPDTANSSFNEAINVPGWRIVGFRVDTIEQRYSTNFGDPTLPAGAGSASSRARLRIDLVRSDPIVFLEMTGPLYIVFFVTVLTFLLTTAAADTFASRIGALGAVLFAVILNMQTTGAEVRSTTGLTLIAQLHILTLGFVLFAMIITTICWRWTVADMDPGRVLRLNTRGILIGTISYALLTFAMFAAAIVAG